MAEAMRRAFADRAEYMGDSDFVKVPVQGLIDKSYAATLRATINTDRASTSAEVRAGRPAGYESDDTTHFTVVDAAGKRGFKHLHTQQLVRFGGYGERYGAASQR